MFYIKINGNVFGDESGKEVSLEELIAALNEAVEECANRYVAMEDVTTAIIVGLMAGLNVMLIGAPGLGKSALTSTLATILGGKYFRKNMHAQVSLSDLLGSFDPAAAKSGKWKRQLSSLATANISLIDELPRAPEHVQNALLDIAEEREITNGDERVKLPLWGIVFAGNSLLEGDESNALWDRMGIRMNVKYPPVSRYADIMAAQNKESHLIDKWNGEMFPLLQMVVKYLSNGFAYSHADIIKEVYAGLGYQPSPRRHIAWMRAATGFMLMDKSNVLSEDHLFKAACLTLWNDDEVDTKRFLCSVFGSTREAIIINLCADLEEARSRIDQCGSHNDVFKISAMLQAVSTAIEENNLHDDDRVTDSLNEAKSRLAIKTLEINKA